MSRCRRSSGAVAVFAGAAARLDGLRSVVLAAVDVDEPLERAGTSSGARFSTSFSATSARDRFTECSE